VRSERAGGPCAAPNANGDLVRETLACVAERIMEAEIEARKSAAIGFRSPMREAQRNGCRNRNRDKRAGRIVLEVSSEWPSQAT